MIFWVVTFLILVAICLMISAIDGSRFVIREYSFTSDKVTNPICIAVVSDLHNKTYGKDNGELFRKLDEINPDRILMTGDILTGGRFADNSPAADFVKRAASKYSVIYANGNHEQRLREQGGIYNQKYETYFASIKTSGVSPLINESMFLPWHNITVYGSEIAHKYYAKFHKLDMNPDYLNKLLGRPNQNTYNILIAHNPDYFEEYATWGADLVLSGHVHGGIVRIPGIGGVLSPAYRIFPKYDGGLYQEKKSSMVLSRGLGTHTLPIRIFNPGELVVIHIKNTKG